MSESVTLKAQNVLSRDYTIIDTGTNVKIVAASLKHIYEGIDKLDAKAAKKETVFMVDYQSVISDGVYDGVAKLLNLSKEDKKKLEENFSYSEVFNFYKNLVNKFLKMVAPEIDQLKDADKAETSADPKHKED